MLSITKLGFNALSRFAKEQGVDCPCLYRGYYNPDGVPYEHAVITTDKTIPADGYWCRACGCEVVYSIFGWSWKDGLHVAHFSPTTTLAEIIRDLLIKMPQLSHIAIMEEHNGAKILWVYRYDKRRL
ncbi:MAG: hypothetical protein AAB477_00965 [Patescibacteria group bacterium]